MGGDFSQEQKNFIRDRGLANCISYLGKPDQDTLIKIYNAADCLLAPSTYEGFGLTILEAMRLIHLHMGLAVEPAGAVGVAALMAHKDRWRGKSIATVLCGGNMTPQQLKEWFC